MATFNPKVKYQVTQKDFPVKDFHDYKDEFVTRPPYQRKNVWNLKKKQDLLDSLFRRFYIPRIVVREIRLDDETTINEIVDGQQRITTSQEFFNNKIKLPNSVGDINDELPGLLYKDLSVAVRRFIDKELIFSADIVRNIDNPFDKNHQEVATEIFWRLQQGESLNFMEVAHSKISSLARNFAVKYADYQSFDYENYVPLASNKHRLPFFSIISLDDSRMKHLALLIRLLMFEEANGVAVSIQKRDITDYIDSYIREDGINNHELESLPHAVRLLRNLGIFYEIFSVDSMVDENNGVKELKDEYFIISIYLLLRHLVNNYVFETSDKINFRKFILGFYQEISDIRKEGATLDNVTSDTLQFSDHPRRHQRDTELREIILRQKYFEYISERGVFLMTKDNKRAFSEAEKIKIYRQANGLCQMCVGEGKPHNESVVTWQRFHADHIIPHSKGGKTIIENSQLLCSFHNMSKGNKNEVLT